MSTAIHITLSPDMFAALGSELMRMRGDERHQLDARVEEARAASGGVRDDDVIAAETEREHLDARIERLDEYLRHAKVSPTGPAAREGAATLGSKVTVRTLPEGAPRTYTLVLPLESDPRSGLLAVDTPLGQALTGRLPGDTVTISSPRGARAVVVDEVLPG